MTRVIALGINIKPLWESFRNAEACKPYPGAGFLPHLARLADQNKWNIMSADMCFDKLDRGKLKSKEVFILQEEMNAEALKLVEHGCKAQVLFCMESQMYAPFFYDSLDWLKQIYKYQILFHGGTDQMNFPCFDEQDLKIKRPQQKDRKELCMISSNKQFWSFGATMVNSPSFREAIENELHTARLNAIAEYPEMDLYGRGWGNLENIPPHFSHLKPLIKKMWKGEVKDKMSVLQRYKKAICFENVSLPGYVTEKVIDCILAGTEPIYMGPKNLTSVTPSDHTHEKFAHLVMELMKS